MSRVRLSENRIEALKPRKTPYDIRDGELRGFGIRVLPSGAGRFFVHSQHEGKRRWKTIGDADVIGLEEARRRAREALAAIRRDEAPALLEERLFEAVASEVFDRYGRNWKPGTLKVNRNYLRNTILPWFGGMNIADIAKQDVQRRFASLRATPVAADRSAPILSVIMRQASSTATARKAAIPAPASGAIAARGASAFCRRRSFAGLRGFSTAMKAGICFKWRSSACCR